MPSFPIKKILLLGFCRLAEPIAITSISPYIFFMIKSFGITEDEAQIAKYAGIVSSSFAFSECLSSVIWGRLSDKYGRKCIIILGLCGTSISVLWFGFSRSFTMIIIARSLAGLLNGNVGVIRTVVAELVSSPKDRARAFSYMPAFWTLGCIIGPIIGGLLADPVKAYPKIFESSELFRKYPYALPNVVISIFTIIGGTVGFFYIQETHSKFREKEDSGRKIRRKIACFLSRSSNIGPRKVDTANVESEQLLTNNASFNQPTATYGACTIENPVPSCLSQQKKAVFTRQVNHCIGVYIILGLYYASIDQIFPMFLSLAPGKNKSFSLFHLSGGLGFSEKQIGTLMSIAGGLSLFVQIFGFPILHQRYGTTRCLRVSLSVFPIVCLLVPFLRCIPSESHWTWPLIVLSVCSRYILGSVAFPCSVVLMSSAAPSKEVLGTINGAAQGLSAFGRAIGPLLTGFLFSLGETSEIGWLVWWIMAIVSLSGALWSLWIIE